MSKMNKDVEKNVKIFTKSEPETKNVFDIVLKLLLPILHSIDKLETRVSILEGSLTIKEEISPKQNKSVREMITQWEKL